jgi:hypothetical protein
MTTLQCRAGEGGRSDRSGAVVLVDLSVNYLLLCSYGENAESDPFRNRPGPMLGPDHK